MLKSIISVTNFLKSPSAGGFSPPAPLNLRFWWPKVTWYGQILFFQADYDEIEIKKAVMTSWPLCHRKMSPKKVTKFSILGLPNQNFWLRQSI